MSIEKELKKTEKMVLKVMAAHKPPINIVLPSDPFVKYFDTDLLFNFTWRHWAMFFGMVVLFSFSAGLVYGWAITAYKYIFVCT
jgi:hypothetical protein